MDSFFPRWLGNHIMDSRGNHPADGLRLVLPCWLDLSDGSNRASVRAGMFLFVGFALPSYWLLGLILSSGTSVMRSRQATDFNAGPRAAFSLVELLTVTAVIGVLAGLALPALASAWSRARSVQCLNQLRQLGLGLKLYADADAEGRLPATTTDSGLPPIAGRGLDSWVLALTNQLSSWQALRICPSDAVRKDRRNDRSSSYLLNTCLDQVLGPDGRPLMTPTDCPRLDQLNSPAGTFLTFEASVAGYQAGEDQVHPETWLLGWEHVLADIDPGRHGRGANYLFGDGHVQNKPALELRQRIERGDNFALPPR